MPSSPLAIPELHPVIIDGSTSKENISLSSVSHASKFMEPKEGSQKPLIYSQSAPRIGDDLDSCHWDPRLALLTGPPVCRPSATSMAASEVGVGAGRRGGSAGLNLDPMGSEAVSRWTGSDTLLVSPNSWCGGNPSTHNIRTGARIPFQGVIPGK